MDDCCHVLNYQGDIYAAVLGLVDLTRGTNSYYKLQVLEHDKRKYGYGKEGNILIKHCGLSVLFPLSYFTKFLVWNHNFFSHWSFFWKEAVRWWGKLFDLIDFKNFLTLFVLARCNNNKKSTLKYLLYRSVVRTWLIN